MLCDPVTYTGAQPKLVSLPLSSGQIFSIQHLSVDYDIEELYKQFFIQANADSDLTGLLERFKESFQYMAGSHTSQAFIASIDQQHIFEIEIHQATVHQAHPHGYTPQPGEFIIQISAGHWERTTPLLYAESLLHCLQYFFQFREVQRILIDTTPLTHAIISAIFVPAGFRPLPGHATIYTKQQPATRIY